MSKTFRFNYTSHHADSVSLMPRLDFTLHFRQYNVAVMGIVDSGSTVNVLPYSVGLALGAVWQNQKPVASLTGNLGGFEARALALKGSHPQLTNNEKIEFVFAWTKAENAPVLFGQINFFLVFDVCFFRAENAFEVRQR